MKKTLLVLLLLVTMVAVIMYLANRKGSEMSLEQSAKANEYTTFANNSIKILSTGNISKFMELISPLTIQEQKSENIEQTVKNIWIPFFTELEIINKPTDINFVEDDGYGNPYAEIYSSFETNSGDKKYFAVVVINENNQLTIGTIMPGATFPQ